MVLEKTLESPLDSRRSNQSILKETSPGCSLEGLMLRLKLLLWPPDAKSQLIGHESEQTLGDSKNRETWRAAFHGVTKNRTRLGS